MIRFLRHLHQYLTFPVIRNADGKPVLPLSHSRVRQELAKRGLIPTLTYLPGDMLPHCPVHWSMPHPFAPFNLSDDPFVRESWFRRMMFRLGLIRAFKYENYSPQPYLTQVARNTAYGGRA